MQACGVFGTGLTTHWPSIRSNRPSSVVSGAIGWVAIGFNFLLPMVPLNRAAQDGKLQKQKAKASSGSMICSADLGRQLKAVGLILNSRQLGRKIQTTKQFLKARVRAEVIQKRIDFQLHLFVLLIRSVKPFEDVIFLAQPRVDLCHEIGRNVAISGWLPQSPQNFLRFGPSASYRVSVPERPEGDRAIAQ